MASSLSSKIRAKTHCKISVTLERPTPQMDPKEGGGKKEQHKCDNCTKSFQHRCHLVIHYRTHTGEKPFECSHCPSKFSRKDHLVSHARTHTGEKPYKCKYCEKVFASAANCRKHTRIHTGEKPYECRFCDYSSNESNNIVHHERTHTGEKPYKCQFCSFSANTRSNIKQHEKTHVERLWSQSLDKIKRRSRRKPSAIRTKEYKCPDCPKAYFAPSSLSRHKKTHAAKNIYACKFCDYFAIEQREIAKQEQQEHTATAGRCYGSELGSAFTKTRRSSVNKNQCRVCGFAVGTDADIALHLTSRHSLPVVTLQRL